MNKTRESLEKHGVHIEANGTKVMVTTRYDAYRLDSKQTLKLAEQFEEAARMLREADAIAQADTKAEIMRILNEISEEATTKR